MKDFKKPTKASVSKIKIFVSANEPQSIYACSELQNYLSRMSGEIYESVSKSPTENAIILTQINNPQDEDSYALKTKGTLLEITGGKRGIIYATYELLEQLGCRFFSATSELIPTTTDLKLPVLDITETPAFEYRDHNYYENRIYTRSAVKLRFNGSGLIREKHGGKKNYALFVHSFQHLVSPKVYGESHPEYFAMFDGERCTTMEKNQLCLTNPEVLEVVIENTRKVLLEHPEAEIISISQNDWNRSCECPKCRERDLYHGSPAGTLIEFVNSVAERLEPEFPNITFDTLAYNYSRPIPTSNIKTRHNVCVRLCSIEACFSHPFEDCDDDRSITLPDGSTADFISDLQNWGKVCDQVYIWDYMTSFSHYCAPHPNWNAMQKNMKAFVKNNVKGVFAQANGASRGGTDFNELRQYVISKLLWNPETDVEKHIREFTDFNYGAAAPYVREYISYICSVAEKENIHIGFDDNLETELFRPEVTDKLSELMQKAKEAVSTNPLLLFRIGKAELSVRWVKLKRKTMLGEKIDPKEVNEFFSDWKAYGMTRLDEWCSPETSFKAILHGLWRGTEFYDHPSAEGPEEL